MLEQLQAASPGAVTTADIILREPVAEDGYSLNRLIAASPPLDGNSVYCNLLQCTHFAGTCVAAERDGQLAGFTSAYLKPGGDNTLFVWQVVVETSARGLGLARYMLIELLRRPLCRRVDTLETTINPGNAPSWKLFRKLAAELGAGCSERSLFERDRHFHRLHDEERLLEIRAVNGPFANSLQHQREKNQP